MDLFSLAIAIGIPSAITGFCFWCLEHHMEKREERDKEERKKRQKEQDEREQAREKGELCIINSEKPQQKRYSVSLMRNAMEICTPPWIMLRK